MSLEKEKQFIDSLIESKDIKTISNEDIIVENQRLAEIAGKLDAPEAVTIKVAKTLKEDDFDGEVPAAAPADIEAPAADLEVPSDLPAEIPEPEVPAQAEIASPVIDAIKALFLTSILKPGANFKEYQSEAMREALTKQGVDDATYNAIGKAFYVLDTKSEMFS